MTTGREQFLVESHASKTDVTSDPHDEEHQAAAIKVNFMRSTPAKATKFINVQTSTTQINRHEGGQSNSVAFLQSSTSLSDVTAELDQNFNPKAQDEYQVPKIGHILSSNVKLLILIY